MSFASDIVLFCEMLVMQGFHNFVQDCVRFTNLPHPKAQWCGFPWPFDQPCIHARYGWILGKSPYTSTTDIHFNAWRMVIQRPCIILQQSIARWVNKKNFNTNISTLVYKRALMYNTKKDANMDWQSYRSILGVWNYSNID